MVEKSDEYFMQRAIAKAREGIKKGQTPFAACIVKNGNIVCCVHNVVRKKRDITAQAEIVAIRRACKKLKTINLSGCTIYSTCEPCPMCFTACHWARISRIVYGATIEDAKRLGFRELEIPSKEMKVRGKSKIKITPYCLRKDVLEVHDSWKKLKNKKTY